MSGHATLIGATLQKNECHPLLGMTLSILFIDYPDTCSIFSYISEMTEISITPLELLHIMSCNPYKITRESTR